MTIRVVCSIFRYPIKGLSPQTLRSVELEAGKPLPFDRVFALARPGSSIDPEAPRWAKKGQFVMLMLDEALASVRTRLDLDNMQLSAWRTTSGAAADDASSKNVLNADLNSREGRRAFEEFIRQQVPALGSAPKVVHLPDGHFMDKPDNVVSCINLATVRSLENEWGHAIDPLRFRANFYIDGGEPWEEFGWVGGDIVLGDVTFRVDRRNGRCAATNVNPVTGKRDLDIPGSLRKTLGHKDLGVYLVAQMRGKVAVGDQVVIRATAALKQDIPAHAQSAPEYFSFICRGCYYIYDGTNGAPGIEARPSFAELAADWRCPDCGTEKTNFRPYNECRDITDLKTMSPECPISG
jgi:GntR family transcriptional regulator/MocR family aminotransferase